MTGHVHGYGSREQLVEQAEHSRQRLIRDGTDLEHGTRLLESAAESALASRADAVEQDTRRVDAPEPT